MMTLDEKIAVMQACKRGEEIEIRLDGLVLGGWIKAEKPLWDWSNHDYRIKPKPKQVVVIEKWLCKTVDNEYYIIEGCVIQLTKYHERNKIKLLNTYEVEL